MRLNNVCLSLAVMGIIISSVTFSAIAGGETIIAIDASASMYGFFSTREMDSLVTKLQAATGKDASVYAYKYFIKAGKAQGGEFKYNSHLPIGEYGRITLLNRCFKTILHRHPHASIVYLVTDNVQDPQGNEEEQGDIEKFYAQLRSSRVKWMHIFPLKRKFRGPLYARNGITKITDQYRGPRGIIVYSILLNIKEKAKYQNQIENFGKRIGFKGIDAKLLEGETVQVVPIKMEVLAEDQDSKNLLVLKNKQLVSIRQRPFSEGEKISGHFVIGFRSKLNYVTIDSPSVKVNLLENFKILGLSGHSSDFSAENPIVRPSPPVLKSAIIPGNFEGGKLPQVRVDIIFKKGVHFKKSLGSLLRYLSISKAGEFKGTIKVKLGVKSSNVKLVDDVVNNYAVSADKYFDSPAPEIQSRILNLDQLFKKTYEFTDIPAESYPVFFQVNYPIWPLFLYLFLVVAIVALLFFLWGKRAKYIINSIGTNEYSIEKEYSRKSTIGAENDNVYDGLEENSSNEMLFNENENSQKLNLLPFFGEYRINIENSKAAGIRSFPPFGLFVIAARRYLVNEKSFWRWNTGGENRFILEEKPESIRLDPLRGGKDYSENNNESAGKSTSDDKSSHQKKGDDLDFTDFPKY